MTTFLTFSSKLSTRFSIWFEFPSRIRTFCIFVVAISYVLPKSNSWLQQCQMKIVICRPQYTYKFKNIAAVRTFKRPYAAVRTYGVHIWPNADVPMHRQLSQLFLGAENGPSECDKALQITIKYCIQTCRYTKVYK